MVGGWRKPNWCRKKTWASKLSRVGETPSKIEEEKKGPKLPNDRSPPKKPPVKLGEGPNSKNREIV